MPGHTIKRHRPDRPGQQIRRKDRPKTVLPPDFSTTILLWLSQQRLYQCADHLAVGLTGKPLGSHAHYLAHI